MNTSNNTQTLKIDLGCGASKKEGFKGMDILPFPNVDYVVDLEEGFAFLDDNSVDEFWSSHFLEHISNLEGVLKEIFRTLKPGGTCTVIVPHFSNPYFYSDYTHKRFFGLYSFDYFSGGQKKMRRRLPSYTDAFTFEVVKRKLVFKAPVFPLNNLFRKYIITPFFNASPWFQEVYETFFSKFVSCYEMEFILRPLK